MELFMFYYPLQCWKEYIQKPKTSKPLNLEQGLFPRRSWTVFKICTHNFTLPVFQCFIIYPRHETYYNYTTRTTTAERLLYLLHKAMAFRKVTWIVFCLFYIHQVTTRQQQQQATVTLTATPQHHGKELLEEGKPKLQVVNTLPKCFVVGTASQHWLLPLLTASKYTSTTMVQKSKIVQVWVQSQF